MNTQQRIEQARKTLGQDLVIFGHHYQNDAVIRHADHTGDSLELARKSGNSTAKHIVFCGVHFMGESAALLAEPGQNVYLPEPKADCVMARMAPAALLDRIMTALTADGRKVIPLTYVNSSLAVKAVCGKYGGSVCTSSNGETMLAWARTQGDAVLFVPDHKLGRNMARRLGIPETEQLILNISKNGRLVEELQNAGRLNQARLLLWPGCCAIHARFHVEHIDAVRKNAPDVQVLVHPECSPEVVAAADFAGSTSAIIKYVEEARRGSVIAIGTEINLVRRLRHRYAGEKEIFPVLDSACSDMAKVTEEKLAALLEDIVNGRACPLQIDQTQADHARRALRTMLEVCS